MNESTSDRGEWRPTDDQLRIGAAALAYVVAAVHLFHPSNGFGRLVLLLSVDPSLLAVDPRPVAFVLSAVAVLVAVPAVARGFPERPVLAAGAILMALYLVGYFAWHFSGHGGVLPGREPLYHGLSPLQNVINHLSTDAWALAAVLAEFALLAVLLLLLYRRRPE